MRLYGSAVRTSVPKAFRRRPLAVSGTSLSGGTEFSGAPHRIAGVVGSTGDLTDVLVPTRAAAANDDYSDNVARKMNATEVKARPLTLLDEVAAGAEL